MAPGARIWSACRTLAVRSRPTTPMLGREVLALRALPPTRHFADDAGTRQPASSGGGSSSSTSSSNGAILGDFETMLDAANTKGVLEAHGLEGSPSSPPAAAQAEGSALTPEQELALYEEGVIRPASSGNPAVDELTEIATGLKVVGGPGHKFDLPELPLPWNMQMKNRYHPVLAQISRLLMRQGRLSKAQSDLARVLNILRTSPPPILSPKYPLLPGAPPAHHLPLNPIVYLTLAIDSVAPLMRIRHLRGIAGGGATLEMPMPLEVRQRRRIAFQWILDAVSKKPSMGSGRAQFAHRLASEIIAVVEGRSGVWDKRGAVHKVATAARANLSTPTKRRK